MSTNNEDAMKLNPWGEVEQNRFRSAPRKIVEEPEAPTLTKTLAKLRSEAVKRCRKRYVILKKDRPDLFPNE